MLVRIGPLIAVAALAAACSSSSKETRTASDQSGTSASGTATAQGTPVQQGPASSAGGSAQGTAGGRASSDRRSMSGKVMKVDPGAGSIMLDPSTSPAMVVIIDQNTRILDPNGQVMSNGIAALREGQQVRASMDPSSHRADEIQITGP